jgi:hypothetical protein
MMLRTVALGTNGPGLREQGTADGRMEGSGPDIQQQHTRRHAERRRAGPHPDAQESLREEELMKITTIQPLTRFRKLTRIPYSRWAFFGGTRKPEVREAAGVIHGRAQRMVAESRPRSEATVGGQDT